MAKKSRREPPAPAASPCSLLAPGWPAREPLRRGLQEALLVLGQGFLSHPDNRDLRAALQAGSLSAQGYLDQLLRLLFRILFLLTVEDRELLHPRAAAASSVALYAEKYSLKRLREGAAGQNPGLAPGHGADDLACDLWEATRAVFRGLAHGDPRLALPLLAGIFAASHCPALDAAQLGNKALLQALFRLSWRQRGAGMAPINWRDMGPETLGSLYESLLELVPQINQHQFAFARGDQTRGNARKISGSYYTPDSLVQALLDSALDPLVESTIAAHPAQPAEALLRLTIVDPACGSGHFLLAAARRLAAHLARLQARGSPSAEQYRRALRLVLGRCLHGVDLDPLAVELCKLCLWLEAAEAGLSLGFLDSHIQHGNALLGATPEQMTKGIPDEAWKPIKGDDRQVAAALRKRNRLGTGEQAAPGRTKAREKSGRISAPQSLEDQRWIADAWCAAFVWPKQPGALADAAPTNQLWPKLRDQAGNPPLLTLATVRDLARQYRWFHWHLQFPEVFARGGFDLVLGNPPWEKVKLQEKEWFAARDPDIARAPSGAARKERIEALAATNPALHRDHQAARRRAEGESHFLQKSGSYPLCARGDINLYAAFAEAMRRLQRPGGRVGCVIPTGIATDDTTKQFFQRLLDDRALVSLFDFENGKGLFPAVQGNVKFCLLTLSGSKLDHFRVAAQLDDPALLQDPSRVYRLSAREVRAVNPNTANCPMFRRARDAALVASIHERHPILIRDAPARPRESPAAGSAERAENPWGAAFSTMFHMTNDSALFKTLEDLDAPPPGEPRDHKEAFVPLHEAKLVHQFHHRAATFEGVPRADRFKIHAGTRAPSLAQLSDPTWTALPRYWVPAAEVAARWPAGAHAVIGFRNAISATADSRSLVATILPWSGAGNSLPLLQVKGAAQVALLAAVLNSFVVDYVLRQKASGGNLNFYILKQLPILAPEPLSQVCPWSAPESGAQWLLKYVLELSYTTTDLALFARDLGHHGAPFRWDPARRFQLRCELDAAFFHLYGLSRAEAEQVLDTFPIVRKNDEKAHGEYRTKRVILEEYEAMAEAIQTKKAYQTRLDPPPADPRAAHREEGATSGGRREPAESPCHSW